MSPGLIAHRGYSASYPENTLISMRKAFESGACFVECDVQITKDKVPVLLHDAKLQKTSNLDKKVFELDCTEIKELSAGYPSRFGDEFVHEKIPLLIDFVKLLQQWPDRFAFVELKRSSINIFGLGNVLNIVLPILESVKDRVIIISFDEAAINALAGQGQWQTGWVIDQWSEEQLKKAGSLNPDYFFVDYECLPEDFESFQQQAWHWVVYEVDDPGLAEQLCLKGADFIETNAIGLLLEHENFSGSGCYNKA